MPRSGMHKGCPKRLVAGAMGLLALQSWRARQFSALVASATCLRSFQHTYEVVLDTIDRGADRRQACASVHLDRR